jgi:hypothetical protein
MTFLPFRLVVTDFVSRFSLASPRSSSPFYTHRAAAPRKRARKQLLKYRHTRWPGCERKRRAISDSIQGPPETSLRLRPSRRAIFSSETEEFIPLAVPKLATSGGGPKNKY